MNEMIKLTEIPRSEGPDFELRLDPSQIESIQDGETAQRLTAAQCEWGVAIQATVVWTITGATHYVRESVDDVMRMRDSMVPPRHLSERWQTLLDALAPVLDWADAIEKAEIMADEEQILGATTIRGKTYGITPVTLRAIRDAVR